MIQPVPATPHFRVSDLERETTAGLLREHLVAGRLTVAEFEERVAEAWRARFNSELWWALRELPGPPAAPRPSRDTCALAAGSIVLGWFGLGVLAFTFGILWPFALAFSAPAWAMGRVARRRTPSAGGLALSGELLGIAGVVACLIVVAGWAAILT